MGQLENMEKLLNAVKEWWRSTNVLDKLLLLVVVLSVTWVKLAPPVLGILFIASIFIRRSWEEFKARLFSWKSVGFWSICFWLYHIVGMAWTSNGAFGWSDIGMKASFIAVPVIAALGRLTIQPRMFAAALAGMLSVTVIGLLAYASWKSWYYPEDNHWAYYFESEYSTFIHRSYWATYTALAASWMLYAFWFGNRNLRFWFGCCWLLLSVSTFLTISKAGIIIWMLLTAIVFIHLIRSRKWWKIALVGGVAFVGLVGFLLFSSSRIASRFQEIPKAISEVKTENNPAVESNTARIIMWSTSIKVIKTSWLAGAGTGDVKDVLIAKNTELGNTGAAEKQLNSHNQFLNTWVQLGIVGFLLLLALFVITFRNAMRLKSPYGILFVVTMVITMCFESFVETQAGIVPFCLLLMFVNHRAIEKK